MATKFSYDKALIQIEELIEDIETESLNVDALSQKITKAATLLKQCKQKLKDTRSEVDTLLTDLDD